MGYQVRCLDDLSTGKEKNVQMFSIKRLSALPPRYISTRHTMQAADAHMQRYGFSTGKEKNVQMFMDRPNYTFIKGDIKDLETCIKASSLVRFVKA